jgi:hypothetical protein
MQEQDHAGQPDALVTRWSTRGAADAPVALRAVVRAVAEGSGNASLTPGSRCAGMILERLSAGDVSAVVGILGAMMETANHKEWFAVAYGTPSLEFMRAYAKAFVSGFLDAAGVFAADGRTVEDELAEGSAIDEIRWRGALFAVEEMPPAGVTMPAPAHQSKPTFVVYQYCVSLGIVSFRGTSGIKVIPTGGNRFLPGLPYTLLSFLVGWWGIPWGPIWTIEAIARNLGGGVDVSSADFSTRGTLDGPQQMCAKCGKPLSPFWDVKCHHCGAPIGIARGLPQVSTLPRRPATMT